VRVWASKLGDAIEIALGLSDFAKILPIFYLLSPDLLISQNAGTVACVPRCTESNDGYDELRRRTGVNSALIAALSNVRLSFTLRPNIDDGIFRAKTDGL